MNIKIVKLSSVDSTNNKAIRLIKSGKTKTTIIVSDKQTKGRGQYGKKWTSLKGNLFMSIFYQISVKKTTKNLINNNCKIIKQTLSKFIKKKINIKFPNDLLIENKKICGILQETLFFNKKKYLIIGIGVNLIKSPKINNYPTSHLSDFMNKKVSKSNIYNAIKKSYEKILTK